LSPANWRIIVERGIDIDASIFEYSYTHPTLFTVTIPSHILFNSNTTPNSQQESSQWHLLGPDIRNKGNCLFPLHTVDIYLWTTGDAERFLDSLNRVLVPGQLRILNGNLDIPTPQQQQLEQRSFGISSTHTAKSTAIPAADTILRPASPSSVMPTNTKSSESFVPMAHNLSAPEHIAHCEESPPSYTESRADQSAMATSSRHMPNSPTISSQQPVNLLQLQFFPQRGPYRPGPSTISLQPTDPNFRSYGEQEQASAPGFLRQNSAPAGYGGSLAPQQPKFVPQPEFRVSHSIHQQQYYPEGSDTPAKAGPGQSAATGKLESLITKIDRGVSAKAVQAAAMGRMDSQMITGANKGASGKVNRFFEKADHITSLLKSG
jgi:hypothetical protein